MAEEIAEIDVLKERADKMGLKYSPNIGLETLRTKIEKALNGDNNDPDEEKEGRLSRLVLFMLRGLLKKDKNEN